MEKIKADLWNNLLEALKSELGEQASGTWLSSIKLVNFLGDKVILGIPNEVFKEWLRGKYLPLIGTCLNKITNKKIETELVVLPEKEFPFAAEARPPAKKAKPKGWFGSIFPKHAEEAAQIGFSLNSGYTFENFVVGPGNRFVHAASLAIVESPAKSYNPLFIHGGVGLGKTHLMHAIGNDILRRAPKTKVLYITSEEFTNRLIKGIQTRSMEKFKQLHRTVDVLLVDDVHFIAGRESTQEEFFHTFNALHDAHKQIILSSDRQPKEISTLEERLISRFQWGLITDIQAPDFETRAAILRKKSEKETIFLPDEVLFFLAEKIKTNIRELEGALIRLVAYAKLMNKEVTLELAKEVLKDMIIEGEKKINVEVIQRKVAQYFDIAFQDMKAKKRTRQVAYPRQVAMYLSRDLTDLSLPEIGRFFGGRDHTTVIHACDKIEQNLKNNVDMRWLIDKLVLSIKQ